jgi:hypothetical protein
MGAIVPPPHDSVTDALLDGHWAIWGSDLSRSETKLAPSGAGDIFEFANCQIGIEKLDLTER